MYFTIRSSLVHASDPARHEVKPFVKMKLFEVANYPMLSYLQQQNLMNVLSHGPETSFLNQSLVIYLLEGNHSEENREINIIFIQEK